MHAHRVEHTLVSALGLLLGAVLAMCIVRGDILLPMVAAITLAVFVHEFFKGKIRDGRHGPLARSHDDKHIGVNVASGHR